VLVGSGLDSAKEKGLRGPYFWKEGGELLGAADAQPRRGGGERGGRDWKKSILGGRGGGKRGLPSEKPQGPARKKEGKKKGPSPTTGEKERQGDIDAVLNQHSLELRSPPRKTKEDIYPYRERLNKKRGGKRKK